MKRYNITALYEDTFTDEDPEGEWVKFNDANGLLEALKKIAEEDGVPATTGEGHAKCIWIARAAIAKIKVGDGK